MITQSRRNRGRVLTLFCDEYHFRLEQGESETRAFLGARDFCDHYFVLPWEVCSWFYRTIWPCT